MELYEAMSTTFSVREFTKEPISDATLHRIFDRARFAPSGGNRQGWRVIVVRDKATRDAIAAATVPAAKRYTAQATVGDNPWNSVDKPSVDDATIAKTEPMPRLIDPVYQAAAVLVLCVDLKVVASIDQYLKRVGVVSGASVYPFAWNVMMSARAEGFGANITTLAIAEEPSLKQALGIPAHVAVAAIMPIGKPVKQLTKLKRKTVPEFTMLERWGGTPLQG